MYHTNPQIKRLCYILFSSHMYILRIKSILLHHDLHIRWTTKRVRIVCVRVSLKENLRITLFDIPLSRERAKKKLKANEKKKKKQMKAKLNYIIEK